MQLLWGADVTTIYNDALLPFLGTKHPEALGRTAREVWHDAWETLGREIELVFQQGNAGLYRVIACE